MKPMTDSNRRLLPVLVTTFFVATGLWYWALSRTIVWWIGHCGTESTRCTAANLFISYGWIAFVLFSLVATILLWRLVENRRPAQTEDFK